MSIAEIRSLPLREKLQIVEAIWNDMSMLVDDLDVSPETRALLDERMTRIQNGSAEVHDWDSVKFSLGKS
jgi:putative addiction module component (TIGR02574 family)